MNNLVLRILSGLVLISLVGFVIHLGGLPFKAFILCGGLLAIYEYSNIVLKEDRNAKLLILVLGALSMGYHLFLEKSSILIEVQLPSLIILFFFTLTAKDIKTAWPKAAALLLVFPYVILAVSSFETLENYNVSETKEGIRGAWIWLPLLANYSSDTFAYFTGRFLGKTPFAPKISPKKTWEGAIGGFIGTILFSLALFYLIPGQWLGMQWTDVIIISMIAAIFGPLGDLVESVLKRSYEIKDSGNLIPGHGGILDRIDSLLVVLTLTTIYVIHIRPFII